MRQRFIEIREIVNKHDPIGLIACGCPCDEYKPEMNDIYKAIVQAVDERNLAELVQSVFARWFSPDLADRFSGWQALASDLYHLAQSSEW